MQKRALRRMYLWRLTHHVNGKEICDLRDSVKRGSWLCKAQSVGKLLTDLSRTKPCCLLLADCISVYPMQSLHNSNWPTQVNLTLDFKR